MGAICGVFQRGGLMPDPQSVEALDMAMVHRGSDVTGCWRGDGVTLGLRLFHTTPESLHERPLAPQSENGLIIVGDCRIDNRDELYILLGRRVVTPCADSTLVLAAYEEWGTDCLAHLIGDFAFAIFDPGKDALFCARDHFGVKPFCYSLEGERFAFASEARALVASGLVSSEVDEERIADFLLERVDDTAITFYRHLRRLPPAHAMWVQRGRIKIWRYWQLVASDANDGLSDEDAAAHFRRLFEQAVECRLRSVHPVGSELSGGLDSSSVTLVANRLLAAHRMPLHTFSTVFPDVPASDESRWMDMVAQQAEADGRPLRRHLFRGDIAWPFDVLGEMIACLGAPGPIFNLYLAWGMLGMARDVGVRVMLTGIDGDNVVCHGLAILSDLAVAGRWEELESELGAIEPLLESYGGVRPRLVRAYVQPVPQFLWNTGHPLRAWRALRVIHRRYGGSRRAMLADFHGLGRLMNGLSQWKERPDLKAGAVCGNFARSRVFRARAALPPPRWVPGVAADHLRGLNPAMTAADFEQSELVLSTFGIEGRHPFFDRRLVEFCLSLPTRHKIRDGWTRVVLRQAMQGVLPEALRLRPDKSNLEHNFVRSLRLGDEGLAQTLEGLTQVQGRYWDAAALDEALARYRREPRARDGQLLCWAAAFAAWARQSDVEAGGA